MKKLRKRLGYVSTIYIHFVIMDDCGVTQPARWGRSINIYKKSPPQAVIATYRTEAVAHSIAIPQVSGGQEGCNVRQDFIGQ
jgi:hypothetical protein